jgi:hypothetical protein
MSKDPKQAAAGTLPTVAPEAGARLRSRAAAMCCNCRAPLRIFELSQGGGDFDFLYDKIPLGFCDNLECDRNGIVVAKGLQSALEIAARHGEKGTEGSCLT